MQLSHLPHSIWKVHSYNPTQKSEIQTPISWITQAKITIVRGRFGNTQLQHR